ncbi:G-type lectin S-receptor-like serine/threonine-protein kinase At4g03230 [Alnus glutinosa]|uniref:G-type lectin S-receptor-like serine/threonine-protein kinase At4g03230 n=1 Tax=Alnus glutinosa TaxID=3517 RepID=UPI002D784F10|nr:G-type lectin S-receptor-like serine/threonine-protein kinase At4g03230 [Alnus glutinosa]
MVISKLQHKNIVKLRGYCIKGEERIILYEYMQCKGLDSFIFDKKQSMCLDWEMRVNIILGIARGLLYLHRDSNWRIIHRDLKPSNILLDEEMNPKISDFGLARIVGGKETRTNTIYTTKVVRTFNYMSSDIVETTIVGTRGYRPPESFSDGLFTVKFDVFSFGILLLEIISGKRNVDFYKSRLAIAL